MLLRYALCHQLLRDTFMHFKSRVPEWGGVRANFGNDFGSAYYRKCVKVLEKTLKLIMVKGKILLHLFILEYYPCRKYGENL